MLFKCTNYAPNSSNCAHDHVKVTFASQINGQYCNLVDFHLENFHDKKKFASKCKVQINFWLDLDQFSLCLHRQVSVDRA